MRAHKVEYRRGNAGWGDAGWGAASAQMEEKGQRMGWCEFRKTTGGST